MRTELPDSTACTYTRLVRAALLVVAAASFATAPPVVYGAGSVGSYVAAGLAALMALAAVRLRPNGVAWRLVATFAFGSWAVATLVDRPDNAGRGLVVVVGLVAFLGALWPDRRLRDLGRTEGVLGAHAPAGAAALVALLFGFDIWHLGERLTGVERGAAAIALGLPSLLSWLDGARRTAGERATLLAGLLVPLAALVPGHGGGLSGVALVGPLLALLVAARRSSLPRGRLAAERDEPGLVDAVLAHPARVLVVSFGALCAAGTLALALPVATVDRSPLPWIDAAFMAVSAVCVTGLAVVDPATRLSPAGQALLLLFIQVGGLGIMVFAAAAAAVMGRRLSVAHERAAADVIGAASRAQLVGAARTALLVTVATEAAVAAVLLVGFLVGGDTVVVAAWRALFTAVSAFCNAGFALQSDSLVGYSAQPHVLLAVAAAITLGGIGPAVVSEVAGWRRGCRLSIASRLVLSTSAILVVVPTVLICAVEWTRSLAALGPLDRVVNALFQAVTLRTAGFNSIDLTAIAPFTWSVMVIAMYIGGSPGSTAGGVKTTTIAVIWLTVSAVIRGNERVEYHGRTVEPGVVLKATAVTALSLGGICLALGAIQLTHTMPLDVALFEVVSALATVGLTVGGTAQLDEIGKLIIIACMFAGRVGPISLLAFLAMRQGQRSSRAFPEVQIPIG